MTRLTLPPLIALLGAGLATTATNSPPVPFEGVLEVVERERYLMGTTLRIRVSAGTRSEGVDLAEEAFAAVERIEALVSTWRPESPVSRLNAAPVGVPVPVDPELLALLVEADGWASRTGRAFDPEVGALVELWDLHGAGRIPTPEEIRTALAAGGGDGFAFGLAFEGSAIRLDAGARLDTGAFGKGAALRAAASLLDAAGASAVLDFGGQILVVGPGKVRVGAAHPVRRGEPVCSFLLDGGLSASTSGSSERQVAVERRVLSHILDPRLGAPLPAWGSVTVVAPDPFAADALSTALYVIGPELALSWPVGSEVGVLVLETIGDEVRARWNEQMAGRVAVGCGAP